MSENVQNEYVQNEYVLNEYVQNEYVWCEEYTRLQRRGGSISGGSRRSGNGVS